MGIWSSVLNPIFEKLRRLYELERKAKHAARERARRQRDPQATRSYQRARYQANIDKMREYERERYKRNGAERKRNARAKRREHYRAKHREWRGLNPEKVKAWDTQKYRKQYAKNPSRFWKRARKAHYKKQYGLTIEEYDTMMRKSGLKCKLCRLPFSAVRKKAMDHCHKTEKVRGVICRSCNAAMGLARDNPKTLLRMVAWLSKV